MNAQENKTSEPTPEQLLKMLDLQMESMRSKRAHSTNRNTIRAASILIVLLVAGGALAALMMMLDSLRDARPQAGSASVESLHQ
ncbi:MAG: hypothetical protein RL088_1616 [Verrucomicrobiota bacterium]|jgi:hypothetical protein